MKRISMLFFLVLFVLVPLLQAENIANTRYVKESYGFETKFYKDGKLIATWFRDYQGNMQRQGEKVSGKFLCTNTNDRGESTATITYKNDKVLDDVVIYRYDNKQKDWVCHYKDGERHGLQQIYTREGVLMQEGMYKNGKFNGLYKWFDEKGRLDHSKIWDNNILEGPEIYYYASGKKKSERNFQNDYAEGPYKSYYESGKVKEEYNYVKNMRQGAFKTFFETGELAQTGTFVDDKAMGTIVDFYKNGNIKASIEYNETGANGKWKGYYEDGTLYGESNFQNDKLNGEKRTYDEKGRLYVVEHFKDGLQVGLRTEYNRNGKKKAEMDFGNGKVKPKIRSFDENGKPGKSRNNFELFSIGNKQAETKGKIEINGEKRKKHSQNQPHWQQIIGMNGKEKEDVIEKKDTDGRVLEKTILIEKTPMVTIKIKYDGTGKVEREDKYDSDGTLISVTKPEQGVETRFMDGRPEGIYRKTKYGSYIPEKRFYPSGKLAAVDVIKDGLPTGEYVRYYENGVISNESGPMINDKKTVREFSREGRLERLIKLNKNFASIEIYYAEGKIVEETDMTRPGAKYKFYDKKGRLKFSGEKITRPDMSFKRSKLEYLDKAGKMWMRRVVYFDGNKEEVAYFDRKGKEVKDIELAGK